MSKSDVVGRSHEAEAFIEAMSTTDPGAVSFCDGWTTHEVTAHVTGIAVEVNRHLDPYLQGDPVPETRSFEEREAPLQATAHEELLIRLDAEEKRMRTLVADVLAERPDSVIPWTGRRMAVAKFIPHLRNEHAIHRWDVVGDDELSTTLLGQTDLTEHSVDVLGPILLVAGRKRDPDAEADFCARLHSEGERDLFVLVQGGGATLSWDHSSLAQPTSPDQPALDPTLECDPAARLLFIWGRRAGGYGRLVSHLARPQLARLQILLSGY
jgi:hypothetical protein